MRLTKNLGVLLALGSVLYGIVGLLMKLAGSLPPELNYPIIATALTILGILLSGLGLLDEIEQGRKDLVDLIRQFFSAQNPYWQLLLVAVLATLNFVVGPAEFPSALEVAAKLLLQLASILGLTGALAKHSAIMVYKNRRLYAAE